MEKKLFLAILSILILVSACSKDRNSSTPSVTDEIQVLPSDVKTCNVGRVHLRCYLDATTPEGPTDLDLNVAIKKTRRGEKLVVTEGFSYVADGGIHRETNAQGIEFDYSVSCTESSMDINVKSTNSPWAMRLTLSSLRSRRPTSTLVLRSRTGETRGAGKCSAR